MLRLLLLRNHHILLWLRLLLLLLQQPLLVKETQRLLLLRRQLLRLWLQHDRCVLLWDTSGWWRRRWSGRRQVPSVRRRVSGRDHICCGLHLRLPWSSRRGGQS